MNICQKEHKNRIEYFDLAKTISIFCVILCHCVEQIYYSNQSAYYDSSNFSKIFSTICFVIGRCGVPFFLFVSGSLLINKKIDTFEEYKKFIKKNFLRLLLTTEIWLIIYNIFLSLMKVKTFNLLYLIENMFFLKTLPLMNIWYMPMILGVYLVIPLVSKAIKSFDSNKVLIFVGILSFITNMLIPTINVLFSKMNIDTVYLYGYVEFLGGFVGIYLITGYLLNNEILKKISNVLLISISIISFIVCMIWNNISLTYYWKYLHYDCIFLYVLTVCLFELFRRINFNKAVNCIRKLIDYISRYSLAIYFIHIIFIMLIGKYLVLYQIPAILKFVLLNVFTVICSFGLAWIISKIQLLKKLLLCIK